ncbi:MAG TPA: GTPase Era [Solirubrobacteraceae bacterium]|nr:GTPase Era [Solirubrobacteraceae bacterium]
MGQLNGSESRSGFVALAGRPNVGKSTLANAIVGARVAIVSDKPQTTRRAIRGVANGPGWQLVLVDLPGVQRPRDTLTARMQGRVEHELSDADGALLVVSAAASPAIGPGDRFIARRLCAGRPVTIAVNKIDLVSRASLVAALAGAAELLPGAEVFPISARTGEGVAELVEHLAALLPPGPPYFPAAQRSDQPAAVRIAELVREQALARTREEIPHALEVEVAELERPRDGLLIVRASVLVETESQKRILIGAGGRMIKAIGVAARRSVERELGERIHLELTVRVRRRWRADEGLLDRLGIG